MFTLLKILLKFFMPILGVCVVIFIAWVNIKYWNNTLAETPDWASKIMFNK